MRRDVHGCFAQMDRSLALPRIRARVLLQQLHTAWREAEFQKVDQAPAAPELQVRGASRAGGPWTGLCQLLALPPLPPAPPISLSPVPSSGVCTPGAAKLVLTLRSAVDTLVPRPRQPPVHQQPGVRAAHGSRPHPSPGHRPGQMGATWPERSLPSAPSATAP